MYAKTAFLFLFASLAYAAATQAKKPDEKEKRVAQIFDMIDIDNDGKISLQEAKTFYNKVGLNDAAIEEQFKKADEDGDKSVSKKEFTKYAKDVTVPNSGDVLKAFFDVIDKDDDHYISLEEAKKFYQSLGIPAKVVEVNFKKADKDGDGNVTFKEFEAFAKARAAAKKQ